MFKNLNRIYLVLVFLLIGMYSFVFGVDFSQVLDQMKTDVFSMWDLFEGKVVVSNIYSKALKLVKDREISSTTTSLDYLREYYVWCPRATTQDFINVIYNSNASFRETFKQILPLWTKKPHSSEINKSYAVFLACNNMTNSFDNIQAINTAINKAYYAGYSNAYSLSALNQDNYGSDLFWNGTLDDSDFDLLHDINQIGNILFEGFKESPQVLFYRLPTVQSLTTMGGWDLSSLTDQSSYQVGGGWPFTQMTWSSSNSSSLSWSSGGGISSISQALPSSSLTSFSEKQLITPTDDQEIQNFVATINTSSSLPGWSVLVFWNQCLSWFAEEAPIALQENPQFATAEEYLAVINNFIDTANIDDLVTDHLLDSFYDKNPLSPRESTSDPWITNQIANTYAEHAFGDAQPWTCEYSCNSLPLDKQAQCQLKCVKSCIQQCDKVSWIQQKALCVSDCTCFLIAGPNGAWREKMEDMFRIKFCKVPSETKKVTPGKKVYSIQAIFQEILDVLQWLKDSGEMIKFSKTKEFLDGTIKIKLADNFAFKVQIWFKPVFPQKSTTIKIAEQIQNTKDLSLSVLNMNTTAPEADDYNKYIVVSDPIKNKANLEQATSLSDINENIQKFQDATASYIEASDQTVDIMRKTYAQQNNILFMNNIIDFLQDNYSFRDNFAQALLDINKMALELKARIEASK